MRWVPAGLLAIAGFLAGLTFGAFPLEMLGRDAFVSMAVSTLAVGLYGGTLVLLPLGALAWVFQRIGLRAASVEWRTLLDLGADRATIVRVEVRDGLRRTALAVGAASVVGFLAGLTLPYYRPFVSGIATPSPYAVAGLMLADAAIVATGALVHWFAARAATAPGPGPGIAVGLEVESPKPSGGYRMNRVLAWQLTVFGVSVGVLGADRVWDFTPVVVDTADVWISNTLGILEFVAVASALVLAARLVAWATHRLAERLARLFSRFAAKRGGSVTVASQLASDGLARRSRLRTLAMGSAASVLAITALTSVTSSIMNAKDDIRAQYVMTYSVAATEWWEDTTSPSGAVQVPLDGAVLEALLEDERIIAIPYGVLRDDPWKWIEEFPDGTASMQVGRTSALVVAPEDLTHRSPSGLRALGFQDGTVTGPYVFPPWHDFAYGEGRDDLHVLTNAETIPFVTAEWAARAYGDVPVTGVLLWPADGAVAAGDSIEFTLTPGDEAMLDQIVADAGGAALPRFTATEGFQGFMTVGSGAAGLLPALVPPMALVGSVLIVALATTSIRDRRRELATVAALGASPRSLRLAPAFEVFVVMLAAAIVGLPTGLAAGLLAAHPTLLQPGAPLDPAETLWSFAWASTHASLSLPLLLAGIALAGCTVAAFVIASTMARGTPVEELRAAEKEGSR